MSRNMSSRPKQSMATFNLCVKGKKRSKNTMQAALHNTLKQSEVTKQYSEQQEDTITNANSSESDLYAY